MFSIIYFIGASLTFNNLPFKGNTPKKSLPTISTPAIANALAESPSVNISVHISLLAVPAQLASSSLGIPVILPFLPPLRTLLSLEFSLALAKDTIYSTIPVLRIFFMNFSVIYGFDPN